MFITIKDQQLIEPKLQNEHQSLIEAVNFINGDQAVHIVSVQVPAFTQFVPVTNNVLGQSQQAIDALYQNTNSDSESNFTFDYLFDL